MSKHGDTVDSAITQIRGALHIQSTMAFPPAGDPARGAVLNEVLRATNKIHNPNAREQVIRAVFTNPDDVPQTRWPE